MGIGVDDDFAAAFFGVAQIAVAQVKAFGGSIVLHGHAQFGAAAKDGASVELVRFAAQKLSAGGMAEDAGIGILDGPQEAGGHFVARLLEAGVNAGDDDVHLGENLVVKV